MFKGLIEKGNPNGFEKTTDGKGRRFEINNLGTYHIFKPYES